jgi:hypothetical protein
VKNLVESETQSQTKKEANSSTLFSKPSSISKFFIFLEFPLNFTSKLISRQRKKVKNFLDAPLQSRK